MFSLGLLIWGICGSTINDSSLGSLTWATRPTESKKTNLVGLNGDTYVQDLGVYFTSASLVLVQPPAFPLILTWGTFLAASLRKTYKASIEYNVRGLPGQYSPYCGLIIADAINSPNATNTPWGELCPPSTPENPYNDCRLQGFNYRSDAEQGTLVLSDNVITFVPWISSKSTAFETTFTFDFRGSERYEVNGFCTGDILQLNATSNTVVFNMVGKIQGAWGFLVMSGFVATAFLLTGTFIL